MHIKTFYCPSTALPRNAAGNPPNAGFATSTYCGNMGFANAGRTWTAANFGCAQPPASVQNGYFIHANNNNNTLCNDMAAILDGTSNTLLVGEVGRSFSVNPALTTSQVYPIWMGGNPANSTSTSCNGYLAGSHLRMAGQITTTPTTAMFPLNYKMPPGVQTTNPTAVAPGVNTGTAQVSGSGVHFSDLSFSSYHPGTVLFAMGDGRVIAIPETTNLIVLANLAGRNEGNPVQLP
jgi:hypothetical protein